MAKTPNEVFQEYLKSKLEGETQTPDELVRRYPEHEKFLRKKLVALNLVSPPDDDVSEIQDLTGKTVGDFKILKEISRGGMGVVYLAEQSSLKRNVALKILKPSIFTDQRQVERFRQEGRSIAKLQHHGIVPVYLIGEYEGLFYIAMQYVEGLPFSKLIRYARDRDLKSLDSNQVRELIAAGLPDEQKQGAAPPAGDVWFEMACTLVAAVGESVAYAHSQGILHRDIKPSNIILTKDGHPVLLDFGLSKDLALSDLTQAGEFIGTPAYSDPATLFDKTVPNDVRSDVYSLGMTLFELVTFNLPYEGKTFSDLVSSIKSNEPRPPIRFNPAVPKDLNAVILKAISREPELRYQTVSEFVEDLKRYLEGRPVLAKAPSIAHRAAKFFKRNRTTAITATVAAILIITLTLTVHRLWREMDKTVVADEQSIDPTAPMEILPWGGLTWEPYNNVVKKLRREKQYAAALVAATDALKAVEQALGPDHYETANSLSDLARLYLDQGKYDRAEGYCKRALDIYQRKLGTYHPQIAEALYNLSEVYLRQEKSDLVEPLYKQALLNYEMLYGKNDTRTGIGDFTLGLYYKNQQQYSQALQYLRRALEIFESSQKPRDPYVAQVLDSLAGVYIDQQRNEQALPLLKRSLAIKERILDPNNLTVAMGLQELASLHRAMGEDAQAMPLLTRSLSILETALGPENLGIVATLEGLARIHIEAREYAKAEPLVKRALDIVEMQLGPDHVFVLDGLVDLAILYSEQGLTVQANHSADKALKLIETMRDGGSSDPKVAMTLNRLGMYYRQLGEYPKAEPLFMRALAILEKRYGPVHPEVAVCLDAISDFYEAAGRPDRAKSYADRATTIRARYGSKPATRDRQSEPFPTMTPPNVITADAPRYPENAVEKMKAAAMQGHAFAQHALAVMYYVGNGVPKNLAEAIKWYQKAAEQGYAKAQFNLGVLYFRGDEVPQDHMMAFDWLQKAAEQGIARAQMMIATMYIKGDGTTKDSSKAMEWFTKAALQEIPEAQAVLGGLYMIGEEIPRDMAKAVEWYRKAAVQGFAPAQQLLGQAYYDGTGVTQDIIMAYTWLDVASARGATDTKDIRASAESKLTPAQLAEAKRLSSNWKPGQSIAREKK